MQDDFVKRVYLKTKLTVKGGFGKLIRKIVLGNVLPNMFFCLGLAKIVFQLDAVKFAIELILSKQRPKFRLHVLFWVSRLEKRLSMSPWNLVFIGYG